MFQSYCVVLLFQLSETVPCPFRKKCLLFAYEEEVWNGQFICIFKSHRILLFFFFSKAFSAGFYPNYLHVSDGITLQAQPYLLFFLYSWIEFYIISFITIFLQVIIILLFCCVLPILTLILFVDVCCDYSLIECSHQ